MSFLMDSANSTEDVELNAESRAKRMFVSVEPIPDRRIYRIDPTGLELYEEYVAHFPCEIHIPQA